MLFPFATKKKLAHEFTGKNLFRNGLSLRVKATLSEDRQRDLDKNGLHDLFKHGKDNFPDILWERGGGDDETKGPAKVLGAQG